MDVVCADQYGSDFVAIYDNCLTEITNSTVYIDDVSVFVFDCSDADMNPDYIHVWAYRNGAPNGEVDISFAGWLTAPSPDFLFIVEPLQAVGPAGQYRYDTQLFDEDDQGSNLYTLTINMYDTPTSSATELLESSDTQTLDPDAEIKTRVLEALEGRSFIKKQTE